MIFNSVHFLAFYPLVTVMYFMFPHNYRWLWLLVSSCYFYMAGVPIFILILFLIIIIDFFAALQIGKTKGNLRKVWLICGLTSNVGVLFFFKYFNFASTNLVSLFHFLGIHLNPPHLDIALPIGLSFHTFQSMSYLFEVYYERQAPENHFGIYALYVLYFPQLVAGPIERPQNLIDQFKQKYKFELERTTKGMRLMLLGFFKKVVIADGLAQFVNSVYNYPENFPGFVVVIGTVFFAFQIYFDFSGYTDIARGSAQILGVRLRTNFHRPYFSRSLAEFWRRWHMSLSLWFRDYVFIPLGGSRGTHLKKIRNIYIVFLLSGLWHGANWSFVVWGLIHGSILVISNFVKTPASSFKNARIIRFLETLITFSVVCFAWIFFRAGGVQSSIFLLRQSMVTSRGPLLQEIVRTFEYSGTPFYFYIPALIGLCCLLILEFCQENGFGPTLERIPRPGRWILYVTTGISLINFGVIQRVPFIYFQF